METNKARLIPCPSCGSKRTGFGQGCGTCLDCQAIWIFCKQCGVLVEDPRKGQDFCGNVCRAVYWRKKNIPRCPHCRRAIAFVITKAPEPRSERHQLSKED